MPAVNPDILRWARETTGLTLEEASRKLRITDARGVSGVDRLAAYEAGENDPTRAVLVRMSKQYRRPLVVFYMSAPPKRGNRGQDFRTLPDEYAVEENALADALIRNVQARQSIVRSALEDEDEAETLVFVGSMNADDGVDAVEESIKRTIEFDREAFRGQQSPSDAFAILRSAVEAVGIFVLLVGDLGSHHTAIDLESFRGFAIADEVAPFVIINNHDSRAAWSFTLIHELVHIWLGQTGVSNSHPDQNIERFCNEVASSFFLQKEELTRLDFDEDMEFEDLTVEVSEFAGARNLSSSMVAYNLFLAERIDRPTWQRLNEAYRELWNQARADRRTRSREQRGGPDYYVVRRHRIGRSLIDLVQRMMTGGALTTVKAGKVLGVKPQNVQKLVEANASAGSGRSN